MWLRRSCVVLIMLLSQTAFASFGGQVFYRGGFSSLKESRGGQVFTDTGGANGLNDKKNGWNIGAGLDLPMFTEMGPGDLLGEVMVEYVRYSKQEVRVATSALLSGSDNSRVTVSALNVLIAPKYKFSGFLDGKLRPWIIPVGLSFLVNSPPTNNTTYLDIGYHVGAGIEYAIIENLSLGLDYRATLSFHENDIDTSYSTFSFYAGINF
ncbi:MAG: outer membrane beta-barrel protein [Bdellovibrionaceae bacterium]|nr:outer membrane beta-barrel protein [Pseudobdellovibrionaceae bacterium]